MLSYAEFAGSYKRVSTKFQVNVNNAYNRETQCSHHSKHSLRYVHQLDRADRETTDVHYITIRNINTFWIRILNV